MIRRRYTCGRDLRQNVKQILTTAHAEQRIWAWTVGKYAFQTTRMKGMGFSIFPLITSRYTVKTTHYEFFEDTPSPQ
jgi:hypothetical protein